jgi:hypothetical protein
VGNQLEAQVAAVAAVMEALLLQGAPREAFYKQGEVVDGAPRARVVLYRDGGGPDGDYGIKHLSI